MFYGSKHIIYVVLKKHSVSRFCFSTSVVEFLWIHHFHVIKSWRIGNLDLLFKTVDMTVFMSLKIRRLGDNQIIVII